MSQNSNAFYTQRYASVVELLSQQRMPKIAQTFRQMTAEGKGATVVDQVGQSAVQERTIRYEPITPSDSAHTRPWVFPTFFDDAKLFDTIDQLQMNASPQSQYVAQMVAAMNRQMDIVGNAAFWAVRKLGENGTEDDVFPSSQVIGVNIGGTNSGLNVEKLQAALEQIKAADVDLDSEQIICRITPKQERQLMNEMEVTSSDYTNSMVLKEGKLSRFLGIEFDISNRLTTDGGGLRRIPLYLGSGMAFCKWGEVATKVSQREDLRGQPWQAYISGNFGAVRVENAKIIEIKCSEA